MPTFLESYTPDGRFLRNCFTRFFNQDLIDFFEKRGGRVFPRSNRALDVVSALMGDLKENQVTLIKEKGVQDILIQSGQVEGVQLVHGG
jgi:predicted flavoprotein YhiN